ncbi:U3 snoRNP protein [Mactra antiquata]
MIGYTKTSSDVISVTFAARELYENITLENLEFYRKDKENKYEIWSLYIIACIKLLKKAKKSLVREQRLQRTLLVFEEAKDGGHLTSDLYIKWIDVLFNSGSPDKALVMSKSAIETYPGSLELWNKRLSLLISSGESIDKIQDELKQAQKSVPQTETWSLVQLVLNHAMKIDAVDTTVRLLESSMIGRSELSSPAKEVYLEYEYLKHGIQHARKIYNRVLQFKPVSLQFYKSYISMELSQANPKMKIIRSVYEEAVTEHGSKNPDIWLEFIKLESNHSKGKPENVGKLHYRAVKALDGALNQEFIKKYTLLQTNSC